MQNSWPTKGEKPSKMFSGSSASGPHKGLLKYARTSSSKSTKIGGSAAQGERHQTPPAIKR